MSYNYKYSKKKQNLTIGTWGNISVLDSETSLVYIKPSGMDYNEIKLEDVIVVDKKGKTIEGFRKPSIEMPMHLSIYNTCLLYTSDAADEEDSVDLGGRR